MQVFVILAVTVLHVCIALDPPLVELSGAVLQIYECPEDTSSEDLLEAAKDYLYHLIRHKQEVKNGNMESLKLLKEVYLEGNPPLHLRNIPWGKLIELYNWNDVDVNRYYDVVSDTRLVWNEVLALLEQNKESDEIL